MKVMQLPEFVEVRDLEHSYYRPLKDRVVEAVHYYYDEHGLACDSYACEVTTGAEFAWHAVYEELEKLPSNELQALLIEQPALEFIIVPLLQERVRAKEKPNEPHDPRQVQFEFNTK